MARKQVPSPAPADAPPWFARLGLSGKLLVAGGLAGLLVAFLPLISVFSQTAMVAADWRGKVCLVGYLAALACTFVLYPPNGLGQNNVLGWAGAGVGLLLVVVSIWLLVLALDSSGDSLRNSVNETFASATGEAMRRWQIKELSSDLLNSPDLYRATVGIGAFLNVVAGAVVFAGGFLKAREEKLI
jgi:hypothetical protein